MTLPTPDATALIYSDKLAEQIRNEINRTPDRFMPFARFMQLALYAPGLGYYSAGARKFGTEGDFVTAPEISPLFARCVANQCRQIFATMPGDFLELGAGSGAFAKDFLMELKTSNHLPQHYYILEVSADLRDRQQTFLRDACPEFFSRIIWLDTLPSAFEGIIFANEVLDALPTHCFRKEGETRLERGVTLQDNQFTWITKTASTELNDRLTVIEENGSLPDDYESEINLMLPAFIQTFASCLKKGALLLCDYGYGRKEYYHPDRSRGTLKCFFRHHHHDNPFLYPGLQDITAHVDFTTVAESAIPAGLSFGGYTTQAAFLLACGLLDFAENDTLATVDQYKQNQGIKILTLPSQMGELIKIISFTKGLDIPLLGFGVQDRRRDL